MRQNTEVVGKVFVLSWMNKKSKLVLIVFLLGANLKISAQREWNNGIGFEGSVYWPAIYGSHCASLGVKYVWKCDRFLALSLGGMFVHYTTDYIPEWRVEGNGNEYLRYSILTGGEDDDRKKLSIDFTASAQVNLPVTEKFGLFVSIDASSNILPINSVCLAKHDIMNMGYHESYSSRVFNDFAPGLFSGAGLYYDRTTASSGRSFARFALSFSRGIYDPLLGYRGVTLDGQNLSDHLPESEMTNRLILSVIIFE